MFDYFGFSLRGIFAPATGLAKERFLSRCRRGLKSLPVADDRGRFGVSIEHRDASRTGEETRRCDQHLFSGPRQFKTCEHLGAFVLDAKLNSGADTKTRQWCNDIGQQTGTFVDLHD